ncbi:LGE1 Transcriptional regulatory protein LGE1 [Candida maltosa Xu316]
MSYDNHQHNSEEYGSYNSYEGSNDEYYSNNYRGNYRGGHRGRGNGNNNNSQFRGSQRGGNGYYNSYRGGYYNKYNNGGYYNGGRGGGNRSYSNYYDQDQSTSQSGYPAESESGEAHYEENSSSSSRPPSSNFHRGSFRGNYRGGYRGGRTNSNGSINSRHFGESKLKNFNNPWINIMQIEDEATQNKLETSYNEMTTLDASIADLQKSKLKLEMSMSLLEKQVDREALHVELASEKLEEFAYL